MQKFIIRSLLFLCIVFLAGRGIKIFVPYHWGNVWYSSKIRYLEQQPARFNTVFFGTSRIYRQVNPTVFDSIVNLNSEENIQTFNLGAPATFCPQTYYLYERFLESELSNNVKHVFIELMEIDQISSALMHQERATYWQNISDVWFVIKAITVDKTLKFTTKGLIYIHYLISYLENLFNIGQFPDLLLNNEYYSDYYVGPGKNGFTSLEFDLESNQMQQVIDDLLVRKSDLNKDVSQLEVRAEKTIELFNSESESNPVHLKRIMELIHKSNERGIRLVFIISPRWIDESIIPLYNSIPEKNKMEFCNAANYPELYLMANSFDSGHLNTRGSNLYTELIAREFLRRDRE